MKLICENSNSSHINANRVRGDAAGTIGQLDTLLPLCTLGTRYLAPALPSTCGSTYNTFCKVHIPRVYHIAAWLGSSTVGLVLKYNKYRLLEYLYLYLTLTFKYILYFTCT